MLSTEDYPGTLYKYLSLEKPYYKDIIKHKLYFSHPSQLNDPHDCKRPYRYDLMKDEDLMNMQKEVSSKSNMKLNLSLDQMRQKIKEGMLNGYLDNSFKRFQTRLGIFCSCGRPDNLHLWKEFASNGYGFAIGIDSKYLIEQQSFAGYGGAVSYVSEFEPVIPYSKESPLTLIESTFFKLKKYEGEDEYRLVKFKIKKRLRKLPEEAFLKIILGYNIPEKEKIKLKRTIASYLPNIEVTEAKNENEVITIH